MVNVPVFNSQNMFAEFSRVPVFCDRNVAEWFLCVAFEIVFCQYEARIRSVIVLKSPEECRLIVGPRKFGVLKTNIFLCTHVKTKRIDFY